MKAIVLYLPVPHQGYLSFLERHLPVDRVFLLSAESIKAIDSVIADQLSRDVRAVSVEKIKTMLWHLYDGSKQFSIFASFKDVETLKDYSEIVMPDEDISHVLASQLTGSNIQFDTVFLRYDWSNSNVQKDVVGEFPVSTEESDRVMMAKAEDQAGKSSDVWRHVGAAIKYGSEIFLAAHNEHMPDPHHPYIYGDVRLVMKPGERPDVCTAIHAENHLIALAARKGIALDGLSIYVTTFPCGPCSMAIAKAGFKKLFFKEGYSNMNALENLQKAGIEIFQVK